MSTMPTNSRGNYLLGALGGGDMPVSAQSQNRNYLGKIGDIANYISNAASNASLNALKYDDPQAYAKIMATQQQGSLRQEELELRKQERADELRRRQAKQDFLGTLSTGINPDVGLTFEQISGAIRSGVDPQYLGSLQGLLSPSRAVGGSTGELADRLIQEQRAAGNESYGISDALEDIRGGLGARGKLTAEIDLAEEAAAAPLRADLRYKPQIEGAILDVKTEKEPALEQKKQEFGVFGKNIGEAKGKYSDFKAAYPQLIDTTDRLKELSKVATYTLGGKGRDFILRQTGGKVGDAGEAAAEMATIIDVEVLPQLKPTFGAAFTVNEGEWLKNTMGDPDLSPEEKIRQINARVRGWNNEIKTLENKLDIPEDERVNLFEGERIGVKPKITPEQARRILQERRGL